MRKMGHQDGKRGKLGELGGGTSRTRWEKISVKEIFYPFINKRCRSNVGREGEGKGVSRGAAGSRVGRQSR